jgi:hypothetical protein
MARDCRVLSSAALPSRRFDEERKHWGGGLLGLKSQVRQTRRWRCLFLVRVGLPLGSMFACNCDIGRIVPTTCRIPPRHRCSCCHRRVSCHVLIRGLQAAQTKSRKAVEAEEKKRAGF